MRPGYVLAGAVAVAAVLGSIHAFSVLLTPLEGRFDASRGAVSLSYSLALLSLTAAVLLGPAFYSRVPAARLCFLACGVAAAGVLVGMFAPALTVFWLGYGLIFGFGNGLGYGFALQIAGRALPGREGIGMGVVTAAYGLGAVAAPAGFELLLSHGGTEYALGGLAGLLIAIGILAAGLMALGNAVYREVAESGHGKARMPAMVWIAYACGVFAGLMALGHATGILRATGSVSALWLAPMAIALANTLASLLAGVLADRYPWRPLLVLIPSLGACALIALALGTSGAGALLALGVVGACYGATITLWPTVIAKRYGTDGPRIYGQVFTGWGIAGLIGPWLAGGLFDATGGYGTALGIAAVLAVIAAITASRLQLSA